MTQQEACSAIVDLLPAYVNRELTPEAVEIVRTHLTHCASCRTELLTWERMARAGKASALHPSPAFGPGQPDQPAPAHAHPQPPTQSPPTPQRQGGLVRNVDRIMQQRDPLAQLVQNANFVGWIYDIDYGTARVMTNDQWKANVLGVPHNAFLVATSFNPEQFGSVSQADREVILLRVIGTTRLPQDNDIVRVKVDHFQQQQGVYIKQDEDSDYDDITRNQIQFGGLECRVLGTFYTEDGHLHLGSDLESFAAAARLQVYRPRGKALEEIVNYVDPLRQQDAEQEAKRLGFQRRIAPFEIGTVRYTSTDRLHRRDAQEKVAVSIEPTDYLGRRTAVLGMTRTGKSNMVKHTIAVVKHVANEGGVKIGQIVFDINGEYANANQQDRGSIADVYPRDTVRYRMMQTPGFLELQNNFFLQLNEGFGLIQRELRESKRDTTDYVKQFINMSLDQPDQRDYAEYERWQRRVAAYLAVLARAAFAPPDGHKVCFGASQQVRQAVEQQAARQFPDPKTGLSVPEAVEWFTALREANQLQPLASSSGKAWVDETLQILLNMLVQKNTTGAFISGYGILSDARKYHSPRRTREVGGEIYGHLLDGKIVILDLSVGDPTLRDRISKDIAQHIFSKSMDTFTKGEAPPNIVVYIEEAHNLIGKGQELTDTWPRLAKEGAKYRIALVYATQEVSSVHPNILSNTENWFITHLNNEREIKELARFYDFDDFSRSLIRAQDVGFARVKTLSSPFTVPVQIHKFDPEAEKKRSADSGPLFAMPPVNDDARTLQGNGRVTGGNSSV